ncbi:MAG: tetratricopeptide repeat protein [Promethearchaeota archaeon]
MDNNQLFEKSKEFFNKRDIINTIDAFEKYISYIKGSKEGKKSEYFKFLNDLLKYCKDKNLKEEEALVLRALGRTYSIFKKYPESLKFHWESLKIQRKIGKNISVAEGLIFLAEDLEVSGDYDECIKTYLDAVNIFRELGKLKKVKDIEKEISRLKEFSREIVEDEYIMNKFHIDKI